VVPGGTPGKKPASSANKLPSGPHPLNNFIDL